LPNRVLSDIVVRYIARYNTDRAKTVTESDMHGSKANMSKSEIQRLIGKALIDEGFRRRLISDPEETIRSHGFQLTDIEIAILKSRDRGQAEAIASELDRRLQTSGWNGPRKPVRSLRY
jgi:hypothetical protein